MCRGDVPAAPGARADMAAGGRHICFQAVCVAGTLVSALGLACVGKAGQILYFEQEFFIYTTRDAHTRYH